MAYVVVQELCDLCGLCLDACPLSAVSRQGDIYIIDADTCTDCGTCSDTCPREAIRGQ